MDQRVVRISASVIRQSRRVTGITLSADPPCECYEAASAAALNTSFHVRRSASTFRHVVQALAATALASCSPTKSRMPWPTRCVARRIDRLVEDLFHVEAERHQPRRRRLSRAHSFPGTLASRRHGETPANPVLITRC